MTVVTLLTGLTGGSEFWEEGSVGDVEDGLEGLVEEMGGVGEVLLGGGKLAGGAVAFGGADAEVPEFVDEGLEGFLADVEDGLAGAGVGGAVGVEDTHGEAGFGDGDASVGEAGVEVDAEGVGSEGEVALDAELEGWGVHGDGGLY